MGVNCSPDAGEVEAVGIPADGDGKVFAEAAGCVIAAGIGQLIGYVGLSNALILAARMKSLSVRPSILCVQMRTVTRPQVRVISGWCFSCSGT